ncbi:MAG: hypothetical protein ABJZ55_01070 [Fuerstiella sp.]
MTNQTNHIQQFFHEHPGPFNFLQSSDGVDGIIAVDCTSTGSYIVASHFWDRDEQEESEVFAETVVFALNMMSSRQRFRWKQHQLPSVVQELFKRFPGPFVTDVIESDYEEFSLVECVTTGQLIVQETRRSLDESKIISATVASALNQLREPRIRDKTRRLMSLLKCRA